MGQTFRYTNLILVLTLGLLFAPIQATGTTYYLDCTGADSNSGLTPPLDWRTLSKARSVTLAPGDALLFRRDCTWTWTTGGIVLPLTASGTSANPIRLGAYGSGDTPVILMDSRNQPNNMVGLSLAGDYLSVADLRVTLANPNRSATCLEASGVGAPEGWYVGAVILGAHVTLERMEFDRLALGVYAQDASQFARVVNSEFHHLNAFWRIDSPAGPMGAIGINLHGADGEYAYNAFHDNNAACVLDGRALQYSAPFEVYNANRANVHHNVAYGHRKHFEVGKDADQVSADLLLAYNLFVSDYPGAVGPNIHGNDQFGPITNTTILHNTIVLTGPNSQAIVCGCVRGATVQDNIFVGEWKAGYFNGPVTARHNLFWDYRLTSDAPEDPLVQGLTLDVTSLKADPLFSNLGLNDYTTLLDYGAQGKPATPTATETATASPSATATASRTATPTASPTATATATRTPTPTATATPTATPTVTGCWDLRGHVPVEIPCP